MAEHLDKQIHVFSQKKYCTFGLVLYLDVCVGLKKEVADNRYRYLKGNLAVHIFIMNDGLRISHLFELFWRATDKLWIVKVDDTMKWNLIAVHFSFNAP